LLSIGSPKIALIVVNWNSGELLSQCIAAVTKQSVIPERIIVVDNASTDESAEDIETRYRDAKVIRLTKNMGFAAANNIGIDGSEDYDWIALVNPDVFPERDWLERLSEGARANPDCAFFGSRMLMVSDERTLDGAGDVYHVSGLGWRRGHGARAGGQYLEQGEVFSVCAAAGLYRRDALMEVGGFDESYFGYFEDTDLAFRLRLTGYRGLYVPDAVVRHIGSATTGKDSDFTVYHGHRNLVWTYFKNMPWPLFWLYLPQHILLNLASILWFTLRGRGKVILKAKWDALKGLPGILKERRRIQRARRVGSWELRRVMARGLLTPYLGRRP
jgi:GT2 family glycosyltransferase